MSEDLPKNITKDKNQYRIRITLKGEIYQDRADTVEEAIKKLDEIKAKIKGILPSEPIKFHGIAEHYGKWRSTFIKDTIRITCGTYNTIEEAALAYNIMITKAYDGKPPQINDLPKEITDKYSESVSANIRHLEEPSTKQFVGVRKAKNKFAASIKIKGTNYHFGTFDTEIEAAVAYNIRVLELLGKDSEKLNTIDEEIMKKYSESVIEHMKK